MRRPCGLLAAFGLALLLPDPDAAAQDSPLNVLLFEKSYVGFGTPDVIGSPGYYSDVAESPLLAEAQISPHLALYRGLLLDELKYGTGWGFNAFLTPQIRLRGYKETSGPVKSVSFMPKFTLQWIVSRGQDPDDPLKAGTRLLAGGFLILGHHSNGGETCEFVDQVQEGKDGACVYADSLPQPAPAPSEREAWVRGGNFSTNYVEIGGGARYGVTSSTTTDHWSWFVEGALSFQHHHNWFPLPLPGGPDETFGALYGLDRVRIDGAGHWMLSSKFALRGSARLDAWSAEAERFAGARNYTLETDLFFQFIPSLPDALGGVFGLGIRYSRGMDYYNTQYVRDICHLQLAAIIDLWTPVFGS